MSVVLAEFGSGQVFWSFLWFFLFFIWIWLLIMVFSDIFRSPTSRAGARRLWSIFIILVPYLGVFVYLIARGHKMSEHAVEAQAQAQDARVHASTCSRPLAPAGARAPPRSSSGCTSLHQQGILDDAEYATAKAKVLASDRPGVRGTAPPYPRAT